MESVSERRWSNPPENIVKVNFDAAFHQGSGESAWGFIARSDTCQFIAAAAGKSHNCRDALQAEAEACVAAVEGAATIGLHRVQFESDCKTLVTALQTKERDLAHVGVLLKEARSGCISSFESYTFSFAPRSCNKVAHTLAQHGLRADVECEGWEDFAPAFLADLVASELAVHSG